MFTANFLRFPGLVEGQTYIGTPFFNFGGANQLVSGQGFSPKLTH
jgi:hypothetical protein